MNTEIKQKWVKALKSGKYQQGRSHLRTNEGFCCLGVLCDIYQKEHPESKWDGKGTGQVRFHTGVNTGPNIRTDSQSESYLPKPVIDWAELKSFNPVISGVAKPSGIRPQSLATANDMGCTFEEIADIIEKQL